MLFEGCSAELYSSTATRKGQVSFSPVANEIAISLLDQLECTDPARNGLPVTRDHSRPYWVATIATVVPGLALALALALD